MFGIPSAPGGSCLHGLAGVEQRGPDALALAAIQVGQLVVKRWAAARGCGRGQAAVGAVDGAGREVHRAREAWGQVQWAAAGGSACRPAAALEQSRGSGSAAGTLQACVGAHAAAPLRPTAGAHSTEARLGAVSPIRMRLGEPRMTLKVCSQAGGGDMCPGPQQVLAAAKRARLVRHERSRLPLAATGARQRSAAVSAGSCWRWPAKKGWCRTPPARQRPLRRPPGSPGS